MERGWNDQWQKKKMKMKKKPQQKKWREICKRQKKIKFWTQRPLFNIFAYLNAQFPSVGPFACFDQQLFQVKVKLQS